MVSAIKAQIAAGMYGPDLSSVAGAIVKALCDRLTTIDNVLRLNELHELAGALGTVEGLARVNAEIEALSRSDDQFDRSFSRVELAQVVAALDSLTAAILSMDRITRELLGNAGSGAVDCVG